MKKVIRLTESDLVKIVKRVISEESDFSSSNTKIELFTDPKLINSIGMYFIVDSDHSMGGRTSVYLKPTPNSKIKCLKILSYQKNYKISLKTMENKGCDVPELLYTNKIGENILKNK